MRPRQRLRARSGALAAQTARALVVVLALALGYYGAMVIALAGKASPHTIDRISAYRTIYDHLATITATDVTTGVRIALAAGGVAGFLVFGTLALRALPRPYLARRELALSQQPDGETLVAPRAIERAAETAALDGDVAEARANYTTDELIVDVAVTQPDALADTLTRAQQRIAAALEHAGLPALPISVTLTDLDQPTTTGPL